MPSVNSELQALKKRIAILEAQQAGGEALSPNYLTVDPTTGIVGALFTGGLQLFAGSSSPSPPNSVEWLRSQTDRKVSAFLESLVNVNTDNLLVQTGGNRDGKSGQLILISDGATANDGVQFQLNAGNSSVSGPTISRILMQFISSTNNVARILGTGAGESHYVQTADADSGGLSAVKHGDLAVVWGNTGPPTLVANTLTGYLGGYATRGSYDPNSRLFGSVYICRNAGLYLAGAGIIFGTSANPNVVSLSVANTTSGTMGFSVDTVQPTAIASGGMSVVAPILAGAGDVIQAQCKSTGAQALGTTGQTGRPGSFLWAMQVM